MAHIRRRGQFGAQKTLIAIPVDGDDFQQKIRFSGQHVSLPHLGPAGDPLLEGDEIGFGLARQSDEGEYGNPEAERLRRQGGMVAADNAGRLEGAHAAQTWRRRNADAAGELDIGDATLRLQFLQDAAVDTVEPGPPHLFLLRSGTRS